MPYYSNLPNAAAWRLVTAPLASPILIASENKEMS